MDQRVSGVIRRNQTSETFSTKDILLQPSMDLRDMMTLLDVESRNLFFEAGVFYFHIIAQHCKNNDQDGLDKFLRFRFRKHLGIMHTFKLAWYKLFYSNKCLVLVFFNKVLKFIKVDFNARSYLQETVRSASCLKSRTPSNRFHMRWRFSVTLIFKGR